MTTRQPSPKAHFIATNGTITVWRPMMRANRVYRSVVIKEFSRSWRAARTSGPYSFVAVRIKPELFNLLQLAKVRSGRPGEDFIRNEHLPPAVREALALAAVDDLVDEIGAESGMRMAS